MAGRLISGGGGSPQHYLEDCPVSAGTVLEVMLVDENWLPVRFETDAGRPVFYFGIKGSDDQAKVSLPENAILRWPGE